MNMDFCRKHQMWKDLRTDSCPLCEYDTIQDLRAERDELFAVLKETHERLEAAWNAGNLPASVIPAELAQRTSALIGAESESRSDHQ